ncbi:MAG: hypothetical protein AAF710_06290 [Planctomycetota bacterium]
MKLAAFHTDFADCAERDGVELKRGRPFQRPGFKRVVWASVIFFWGLITGMPLGSSFQVPVESSVVLPAVSGMLMFGFLMYFVISEQLRGER